MAAAVGCGSATSGWAQFVESAMRRNVRNFDKKRFDVYCVSSAVSDPYKTLKIDPGASESEVEKAIRKLALQVVMSHLQGEFRGHELDVYEHTESANDDEMRGINDPDWDLWEEWMGWEGAGIRDSSSHINPYI